MQLSFSVAIKKMTDFLIFCAEFIFLCSLCLFLI